MGKQKRSRFSFIAISALFSFISQPVQAIVWKCEKEEGSITYQTTPCNKKNQKEGVLDTNNLAIMESSKFEKPVEKYKNNNQIQLIDGIESTKERRSE